MADNVNRFRVDPFYVKMMGGTSHPTAGTIGGAMDYIGELSQSSQFKFNLYLNGIGTGEPNEDLNSWLNSCGLFGGDSNDQTLKYELLCHQAQLPGTQFELATEKGGFQGLTETFARARQFTQFAVSFYVDTDYNVLRLFEEWMNFINPLTTQEGPTETGYPSGSLLRGSASDRNGFLRMRYPESYKKIIGITKFERNAGFAANTNINESTPGSEKFIQKSRSISYQFINAFPIQVAAVNMSYGGSEILKVDVVFNYDRYITIKNDPGQQFSPSDIKNLRQETQQLINQGKGFPINPGQPPEGVTAEQPSNTQTGPTRLQVIPFSQ